MNLLLICHEYPPLGGGGGRQLANLARMYAKNHTVYFLTVGFQQSGVCQHDGYTLHRLPARRKYQTKPSHIEFLSFLSEAWKTISHIMETFQPDAVHVFFTIPEGLLLFHPRLRSLPGIISVCGADVPGHDPNRFPILYHIVRPIVKKIWNHAQHVICNSHDLRNEVLSISPKLSVDIIPNGIDCDRFKPLAHPKSVSDGLTLLYVGRLIPLKRIDIVIQAVAQLRDQAKQVTFHIIGSGEQQRELQHLVTHLKLEDYVKFGGNIDYEHIHTIYRQADIYIQLSIVEGMSNSILEALASGLPVITSNVGGASTFMENNGALLEQPTAEAVVRCIDEYLHNPALLKEHGQQSRRIAERYRLDHIVQQYTNQLASCILDKDL